MDRSWRSVLLVVLALSLPAYLVVPQASLAQVLLYQAVCLAALVLAVAGVVVHRPVRSRVWWALLGGAGCWVVGEYVWAYATWVLDVEPFPSAADALFVAGYLLLGLGLAWLVRGRQPGRDRAALLDSAIVTVGAGVVVGAFLVVPLALDAGESVLGRLVGSAYPLGSLLLLGMLVRLVSTPGARSAAYRYLVGALLCSLVADAVYNVVVLTGDGISTPRWLDATWLACYVLLAAAVNHPSVRHLAEPAPEQEERLTRRRLVALAVASSLAPATLLLQQALGRSPSVTVVAVGSLVLSCLVLVRMAGLLEQVRGQAVRLAALAALDGLTGAANRRTWDLSLSHACARARDEAQPLAVALVDLDHFKAYNDTRGHQAGDRLLVSAVAAWGELLGPDDLLARYGGEEFAVLLPGRDAVSAAEVLGRMLRRTPESQTFSAGVTTWVPGEDPSDAVARADEALYAAKAQGRRRVCVSGAGAAAPWAPPSPRHEAHVPGGAGPGPLVVTAPAAPAAPSPPG